ncbi:hypothetical protein DPMN_154764 [Dreissena polymorpha]|uniref:Uncharacterized protein n=1 Tax=Dreissena polymorpha TaxID=45954 RepID=A0A9D4FPW9_DREPO|nr:hypothetical protein DPMN_154764 [Dreissena polymorpha]
MIVYTVHHRKGGAVNVYLLAATDAYDVDLARSSVICSGLSIRWMTRLKSRTNTCPSCVHAPSTSLSEASLRAS